MESSWNSGGHDEMVAGSREGEASNTIDTNVGSCQTSSFDNVLVARVKLPNKSIGSSTEIAPGNSSMLKLGGGEGVR